MGLKIKPKSRKEKEKRFCRIYQNMFPTNCFPKRSVESMVGCNRNMPLNIPVTALHVDYTLIEGTDS